MATNNEIQRNKSKITRMVLLIEALVTKPFPWLKKILRLIPEHFRPAVYLIVVLVISTYNLWDLLDKTVSNVSYWLHGPKVIITMLPQVDFDAKSFGDLDVIDEFRLDAKKVKPKLKLLHDVEDFKELLSNANYTIPIKPFTCDKPEQSSRSNKDELYRLSLIAQNIGDSSPGEYELTITFNVAEARYGDPGVRILDSFNDDLTTAYIYSQKSAVDLPSCVKENDDSAPGYIYSQKKKIAQIVMPSTDQRPSRPSYLVRKSYEDIGLTRELIILKAKLDPQLFQTINLLVTVPPTTNHFIMLYHVKCTNCSRFTRHDSWYGQVIHVLR